MSAELIVLQQQLEQEKLMRINAMQQVELVRKDLQLVKAKKAAKLENSLFSPDLMEHYEKVAEKMAKSALTPKDYYGKPNDIFIAFAKGYQLGIPLEQCLESIAVINGRASIWGDAALAVVMSNPQFEYIDEGFDYDDKGNLTGAYCRIKRRGLPERIVPFTIQQAAKAKLLEKPGPWTQYRERMLQLRARGFALRDLFPDSLKGLIFAEEARDYIEGEIVDTEPKNNAPLTQVERLKSKLEPLYKGLKAHESNANSSVSSSNDSGHSHLNEDKQTSQKTAETTNIPTMAEGGAQENPTSSSKDDDSKATPEQRAIIKQLRLDKQETHNEEIKSIFEKFGVPSVKDLTLSQADDFIFQLQIL